MSNSSALFEAADDDDRRTFAPSTENREVLELLVEQGHFKTAIAAFQAAGMLALRKGLEYQHAVPTPGTMWNRGSVNLSVLDFLSWYLPTKAPVRALAQLGNVGTDYIAEKVRTGGYSLTEIFELDSIESGDH